MRGKPIDQPERSDSFRDQIDHYTTFILANLLWVITSIPIVTLPTATAALFSVMSEWQRGKRPEVLNGFFSAMRQHWRKATVIGLADAVIVALIAGNTLIFQMMDMSNPVAFLSRSMTFFVAVALIMLNLYLWTLMVIFDMPLRQLLSNAFQLAFGHPIYSIGVMLLALLPFAVTLVLPKAVLVLCTFSIAAYLICWGTWRHMKRYIAPEELERLEARR